MSRTRKAMIVGVMGVLALTVGAVTIKGQDAKVAQPNEADQYRAKAVQVLRLNLQASRASDDAWKALPAVERERLLQLERTRLESESDKMISDTLAIEATNSETPCPFQGLRYPGREPAVPVPFHGREFIVVDYWGGVLDDSCIGIFAGYEPANPLQGELAVYSHPDEPLRYELYPTPSATGPIRIIAEANGQLKISSLKGTFDQSLEGNTSSEGPTFEPIKTPGGTLYTFDVRAMQYR